MSTKFTVQIDSFTKLNKLPNAWSNEAYTALLAAMDLDDGTQDMNATELREMCMMSLNDLQPDEAAKVVLSYLFTDETAGKIEQLSHDMLDNRLWEEYSNCLYHEGFFNAYALLREAFNGTFAQPTGLELMFSVTGEDSDDMTIFDESLYSSIVRLLANGQGDDALIARLYEEQIEGNQFPQAPGIVWQLEQTDNNELTRKFRLVSSCFWFGSFENIDSFEAETHADVDEDIDPE